MRTVAPSGSPWLLLRKSLQLFAPILVGLLIFMGLHHHSDVEYHRKAREQTERSRVTLFHHILANHLHQLMADSQYLAASLDKLPAAAWKQPRFHAQLTDILTLFGEHHRNYDELSLYDAAGAEVYRLNLRQEQLRAMPLDELPANATRLDLGLLETARDRIVPLPRIDTAGQLSAVRLGMALPGDASGVTGAVTLSCDSQGIIAAVHDLLAPIGDNLILLDSVGTVMPMQTNGSSGANDEPSAAPSWTTQTFKWQDIFSDDRGQIYEPAGLVTYDSVSLPGMDGNGEPFMRIVSFIDQAALNEDSRRFFSQNLLYYTVMTLLAAMSCAIYARSQISRQDIRQQMEYERRFRQSLEDLRMAAVMLDQRGNIHFCNHNFTARTGWRADELDNACWLERIIAPGDRAGVGARIRKAMERGETDFELECRIRTHHNGERLYHWRTSQSKTATGTVLFITWLGDDVTEQRKAETQLLKLNQAIEQTVNVIVITDIRGIVEYVNPKFTEVTGYAAAEVVGGSISILKSGETSNEVYAELWDTLQHGGEWHGLFHNRRKNGELYWDHTSISPIRNQQGMVTHFLAVKEDMTQLRRLEQHLEDRDRELSKTRELAAVGRMANMVAHDLRNPLTSIKMGLQLLAKADISGNVKHIDEVTDIGLMQVRYMEGILSDLLSFAAADTLSPEWISLEKLLDTVISSLHGTIDDCDVRIINNCNSSLPTLNADPVRLRQLFSNLIINAVQASQDGADTHPSVVIDAHVSLEADAPSIVVHITDTGPGISAEVKDSLFEPFVTTKAKGTGLGLSIVAKIVSQHHGSITLKPAEPAGTVAAVQLPLGPLRTLRPGSALGELTA